MGPIELADTVGLDICLHVARNLAQHMEIEVPDRLQKMVDAGFLGKKSGRGFYQFKDGKPVKDKPEKEEDEPDLSPEELMTEYRRQRDGLADPLRQRSCGLFARARG